MDTFFSTAVLIKLFRPHREWRGWVLTMDEPKTTEPENSNPSERMPGKMNSDKPDNRPAWSQQLGETEEAFAAFVVYRDLGPTRSLAEAQRLKRKPRKGRKRAAEKRQVSGNANAGRSGGNGAIVRRPGTPCSTPSGRRPPSRPRAKRAGSASLAGRNSVKGVGAIGQNNHRSTNSPRSRSCVCGR